LLLCDLGPRAEGGCCRVEVGRQRAALDPLRPRRGFCLLAGAAGEVVVGRPLQLRDPAEEAAGLALPLALQLRDPAPGGAELGFEPRGTVERRGQVGACRRLRRGCGVAGGGELDGGRFRGSGAVERR
jgi:hypothetical protein